jgi:hypothetical protein
MMQDRAGLVGCLIVLIVIALIIGGAVLFTRLSGG